MKFLRNIDHFFTALFFSVVFAVLTLAGISISFDAHANPPRAAIFSATYDPASLADGVGATTTVAAPGAALGDSCIASFSLDLQGILTTCYISAANVASVRFQNETTGTLDLASGTLRVRVFSKTTQ